MGTGSALGIVEVWVAMQVGLSPFHHQQSCWGKRAEPQTRCTWICILGLFAWTPQEQDGDGSSLTGNATGDFLVAVGFLSKPQGYDVPMSRVFPPPVCHSIHLAHSSAWWLWNESICSKMFSGVLVCIKLTPRLSRNHSPHPPCSPPRRQALSLTSTSTFSPKGSRGQLAVLIQGTLAALGQPKELGCSRPAFVTWVWRPGGPTGCIASQCFLSLFVRVPNFKMKCEYILCVGAM